MAKVVTRGTRSTQRARLSYSTTDPADQTPLQESLTAWAAVGDPFNYRLSRIETWCMSLLQAASINYDPASGDPRPNQGEPDSREGYALRALDMVHSLRRFIDRGDAKNAANLAIDLGVLLTEASMKKLADRGFSDAVGMSKKISALEFRNKEICKTYVELIESGLNRKTAKAKLEATYRVKARQLETILPPSRRK